MRNLLCNSCLVQFFNFLDSEESTFEEKSSLCILRVIQFLIISGIRELFSNTFAGADFDTWDPNAHLCDVDYHPLNDPSLWRLLNVPGRRKILRHHNLITKDGNVRVGLKEYNRWRRALFRQQLQLVNQKRAIADRNQLCGMIKGTEILWFFIIPGKFPDLQKSNFLYWLDNWVYDRLIDWRISLSFFLSLSLDWLIDWLSVSKCLVIYSVVWLVDWWRELLHSNKAVKRSKTRIKTTKTIQ